MPERMQPVSAGASNAIPRPVSTQMPYTQQPSTYGTSPLLESTAHYHSSQAQAQAQAQAQTQDFAFSDDALWEAMFANAGFNITDGTFLPDAYEYQTRDND